jgi:hypothetical protein
VRIPLDTDTYAVGRDLQLERVIRTASLRKTLLEQHKVMAVTVPRGRREGARAI